MSVAEETQDLAHQRRWRAAAGRHGQGHHTCDHRQDRHCRRDRLRDRVCGLRHTRAQHGRPFDRVQHVDRSRRARRHDRTRRKDLRLSRRTRIFAKRRALGQSTCLLALVAHRRWCARRPRSDAGCEDAGADGDVGHKPRRSGADYLGCPRSRFRNRRRQARTYGTGAALHGTGSRHAAAGHKNRSRIHRHLHQRAD